MFTEANWAATLRLTAAQGRRGLRGRGSPGRTRLDAVAAAAAHSGPGRPRPLHHGARITDHPAADGGGSVRHDAVVVVARVGCPAATRATPERGDDPPPPPGEPPALRAPPGGGRRSCSRRCSDRGDRAEPAGPRPRAGAVPIVPADEPGPLRGQRPPGRPGGKAVARRRAAGVPGPRARLGPCRPGRRCRAAPASADVFDVAWAWAARPAPAADAGRAAGDHTDWVLVDAPIPGALLALTTLTPTPGSPRRRATGTRAARPTPAPRPRRSSSDRLVLLEHTTTRRRPPRASPTSWAWPGAAPRARRWTTASTAARGVCGSSPASRRAGQPVRAAQSPGGPG